jgi:hypothetical protein
MLFTSGSIFPWGRRGSIMHVEISGVTTIAAFFLAQLVASLKTRVRYVKGRTSRVAPAPARRLNP